MPDTNDESKSHLRSPVGSHCHNDGIEAVRSGVKGLKWKEVPKNGEMYTPRYSHCTVELDGSVYVFGGDTGNFYTDVKLLNDLYVFDAGRKLWRRLKPQDNSPHVPPPRCGHTLVPYNGRLFLFGGSSVDEALNDLWVFDPSLCTWEELSPSGLPPSTRLFHTAVVHDDSMYVFGGSDGDNEIWRLSFTNLAWQKVPIASDPMDSNTGRPSCRWMHTATAWEDSMYVYGGEVCGRSSDELWQWSFLTNRWAKLEAPEVKGNPPCGRSFHASATLKRKWLIHAGRNDTMGKLGDAYEYHFEKKEWKSVTTMLAPWCQAARWGHCIVFVPATKSYVVTGGVTTEVLVLL